MNYINQLNGFFNKANGDSRVKPNHISLYLMLFNSWNLNRFNNPTGFSKEEIMKASKIRSNATYYKCMKELQTLGFIEYLPALNAHSNANVIMVDLSEYGKTGPKIKQPNYSNFEQDSKTTSLKNSHANEHVNELAYILYNKKTNTNNLNIDNSTNSNFKKNNSLIGSKKKEEKSSAKKEEKIISFEIPSLESVVHYFIFKLSTETEGNKFFNYYSSIDWLIGGKTKMRDWKAVARNWMMNTNKFKPKSNKPQPNHLHTPKFKNYDEPL